MVLPLVKLGTLALKTLCKPVANRLKKEAGVNPRFRQFIINIAQANHRFTTKLQRHVADRASGAAIRPLNEERAVQAAADLLGELFAFTVAGAALVYEVQRNARSEARKEENRQHELEEIRRRLKRMENEIKEMKRRCCELEQLSKSRRGLTWLFNFMYDQRAA